MASEVMHQPGDSARHDDHFHLRVYCSRDDRLEGLHQLGATSYLRRLFRRGYGAARSRGAPRGLMDPGSRRPPKRASTSSTDCSRGSRHSQSHQRFPHQVSDVQIALMDLLGELDQPGVTGTDRSRWPSPASRDEVRRQALWLLGAPCRHRVRAGGGRNHGSRRAGPRRRDLDEGGRSRRASQHHQRRPSCPQLLEAIADPRPRVRERVAHVLHRTTGPAIAGASRAPTSTKRSS